MPCAISYHAAAKNKACQFNLNESELIDSNKKKWCLFHLPLTDDNNDLNTKANWRQEQICHFTYEIKKLLKANFGNFKFVTFPYTFQMPCLKQSYNIKLYFNHAIFADRISFSNKKFRKKVYFNNTTFIGEALFYNSSFQKKVTFLEATFCQKAFFDKSIFNAINFSGTLFHNSAYFRQTIFDFSLKSKSFIRFNYVTFKKHAYFKDALFNSSATFIAAQFHGIADFSLSSNVKTAPTTIKEIDFEGSQFQKIDFINREFTARTNFTNCIFKEAPNFHGCLLHQNTIFPSTHAFKDTASAGAAQAYRTLNLAMANMRARNEEAMFYILEKKSQLKTLSWFEWLISKGYGWAANYGQSITRPLFGLGLVIILFSLFYVCLISSNVVTDEKNNWLFIKEALSFSFQQTVYIARVLSTSQSSCIAELIKLHPWVINIAFIQSILSYILLALFLFSLRWRFKRE